MRESGETQSVYCGYSEFLTALRSVTARPDGMVVSSPLKTVRYAKASASQMRNAIVSR